jgi:hypothetical protein
MKWKEESTKMKTRELRTRKRLAFSSPLFPAGTPVNKKHIPLKADRTGHENQARRQQLVKRLQCQALANHPNTPL